MCLHMQHFPKQQQPPSHSAPTLFSCTNPNFWCEGVACIPIFLECNETKGALLVDLALGYRRSGCVYIGVWWCILTSGYMVHMLHSLNSFNIILAYRLFLWKARIFKEMHISEPHGWMMTKRTIVYCSSRQIPWLLFLHSKISSWWEIGWKINKTQSRKTTEPQQDTVIAGLPRSMHLLSVIEPW